MLQQESHPLLFLFLKEHGLSLLLFALFSLVASVFFALMGQQFYRLAVELLKQEIDVTQRDNQKIQRALFFEKEENRRLARKKKLFVQTAKRRESLICDVLMRQRLMREKAYLTMAVFLENEELEEKERGLGLWIKDMRNHFGLPHIEAFQLRPVFEQVLAVLAQEIDRNKLQVSIEDRMASDVIETDRLILSVVLTNILNRCIVRLPREGNLQLILLRKKNGFKIEFLDDGYASHGAEVLTQVSRHKFFFLEPDVLENLCTSIRVKITTKDRAENDPSNRNSILFEVPIKIKCAGPERVEEKIVLPANVIRFPQKRRKRPERAEPL